MKLARLARVGMPQGEPKASGCAAASAAAKQDDALTFRHSAAYAKVEEVDFALRAMACWWAV